MAAVNVLNAMTLNELNSELNWADEHLTECTRESPAMKFGLAAGVAG